jgi:hypothetical protein
MYQRLRTQGRLAFRKLHEFLAEGASSHQVTLAPHLVMRGNLEFFLKVQSQGEVGERDEQPAQLTREAEECA